MPNREGMIARVRALLARASDPGATEEEQRTSAVIAARLMREHGISLDAGAQEGEVRERSEVVIGGVRTIVESFRMAKPQIDAAFGFDLFEALRDALKTRAQAAITQAATPPAARARRRRKKK